MDNINKSSNDKPVKSSLEVLKSVFGYDTFRGEQEEIIHHTISGNSSLVLMPTGGGKSLCYQIPALCMDGLCIVVSPLIALMQDQVNALKEYGVKAEALNSSLDYRTVKRTEETIKSDELKLLYIAPERLMTGEFLSFLADVKISLIAIDEAHCISSWGHDFRPEYLALSRLSELFPNIPRLALTATADVLTRKEIINKLNLQEGKIFLSSFDRPNIKYNIIPKDNGNTQLINFLNKHKGEAGVVYCMSRNGVEKTAEYLREKGFNALPYHAGLDKNIRTKNQDTFLKEDGIIIVATIAFGMGIDKSDVRFVVHLDMPKSIESYYQETGRAGRDGLPSEVLMLYGMQDVAMLWNLVKSSEAEERYKRIEQRKVTALLGLCETIHCRRKVILEYFGEKVTEDAEDSHKYNCSNCDNCINPITTFDGTVLTQKAISAVYRTGQIFGAGHVIDNLLGKNTEKMKQFKHDKLSTFGIGMELTEKQWKSVFRQLTSIGLLVVDMENHGSIKLSNDYKNVLNGGKPIYLRHDPEDKKKGKITKEQDKSDNKVDNTKSNKSDKSKTANDKITLSLETAEEQELFIKLKAKRLELAKAQNLPPYIIFHDTALIEMVKVKPKTAEEMGNISGVGAMKLEKYGDIFLGVINESV